MTGGTADALFWIGVCAVTGTVAIVVRHRCGDRGGPILPSDLELRDGFIITSKRLSPDEITALREGWADGLWGDQPNVPVFHSPSIDPEAQHERS